MTPKDKDKNKANVKEASHQTGHRQRLKARFMKNPQALADYEMLESVLFLANARKDTKPMAKDLLKRFGDISAVLGARVDLLGTVDGIGEQTVYVLKLIEALAQQMGQSKIMHRSVINSWDDLKTYCRTQMAEKDIEEFRVIFLDRRNAIITDELISQGTVDHTPVYPREIARRAISLSASGIVIAHNHPSGDPKPSQADIDMTLHLKDICENLGIVLHDHLVVGRKEVASFKLLNLL